MSLPFLPVYVADFEADTQHLTTMQDGAFNRLLRLQWKTPGCTMPDDLDWIRARVRATDEEWRDAYLPVLSEFFKRRRGRIVSKRLKGEFEKASATSKKRSAAGKKGGRPLKTADPSRVKNRSSVEQVSFSENRDAPVKTLETNDTAKSPDKAGPNHLELELELDIEREKEAAATAARDGFLDKIREAANAPDTQAWITDPFLGPVVARWSALGLTQSEILDIIRATARGKRIGSPGYFDGAMQDFAGRKAAPPLSPSAPGPPRPSGSAGPQLAGITKRWVAG